MMLYLAADIPLPPVADTPHGPLVVSALGDSRQENLARQHFTKAHVYLVGSHGGCGCGFSFGYDGDSDGRGSVRALHDYLNNAIEKELELEVFATWTGDEAEGPTRREETSPAYFDADAEEFELREGWFATIRAAAS